MYVQKTSIRFSLDLKRLLDEIRASKGVKPYKLYFDNLFAGMIVLRHLNNIGCVGTGTIQENQIPKSCSLTNKKLLQNSQEEHESALDKANGILLARWVDNGVVTTASTCFGVNPFGQVRRYSQAEKKCNAWQLDKKSGGSLAQLNFRRAIVQKYLKSYGIPPKGPGRPSISSNSVSCKTISDDLRYDAKNHIITRIADNKRRRYAGEDAGSKGLKNACTVKALEDAIKNWLRRAKERLCLKLKKSSITTL
ncbi:hypothetical protein QE152_g40187 [Popillia japonica]|uniref:PiggyBac transposable element-derived protein domain-containing protein n=1 Tax=Popillia japonica TaxID=7064 RepID=A0AAW1HS11_POPJA